MRIAVVHSFYSSAVPSGENVVVKAQVEALRDAGHEVLLVAQHTDVRARRRTYPLESAVSVATGVGPDPRAALRAFQPDVVHVHNLFPNFGTAWLDKWPGPVVATLHNFRPMCAAAVLFRDGHVCTECPDGDRWAGLRHGCYRGSRVATAPLAWRNRRGVTNDPIIRRADTLIVLSDRARRVYEAAGVAAERLRVVPNFVDISAQDEAAPAASNGRWLFVGRLTPEKGIVELARSWPAGERLDVVGDGPLLEEAREIAPDGVTFLGPLDNATLRKSMPEYLGLVIPSRCYENLPTVYLEALAAGLPTVARTGNSAADDVDLHQLGVVVPEEASAKITAASLETVRAAGRKLRAKCSDSFSTRFTISRWLAAMYRVYGTAATERGVPRRSFRFSPGEKFPLN